MNRNGQGLSVNMIILIALGVVILIISVLMYSNSVKKGQATTDNCELLGGVCKVLTGDDKAASCAPEGQYFGSCNEQPKGTTRTCCAKPTTT